MKNIFRLVILIMLAFASCEPIEKRTPLGGEVSDADIAQYIKVYLEPAASGRSSNLLKMESEGLKARTKFNFKQGEYIGVGGEARLLNKGTHTVTATILNPNGKIVTKDYQVTVEEVSNVDNWIKLCGENGRKTWSWDTRMPRSTAPGWTPEPGVEYLPEGAGVYGLIQYRNGVYPQLSYEWDPLMAPGDYVYAGIVKPLPEGYLDADWKNPVLSSVTTNPAQEGVRINAAGEITDMCYMTFDVTDGFKYQKTRLDGSVTSNATFSLDFGSNRVVNWDRPGINPETGKDWFSTPWAIGQMIITGANAGAPYYRVFSVGNASNNAYTYSILVLEEDLLILGLRAGTNPYTNYYCYTWVYRPYQP